MGCHTDNPKLKLPVRLGISKIKTSSKARNLQKDFTLYLMVIILYNTLFVKYFTRKLYIPIIG